MNLNKVYLIGRLTQEPEMRAIPSGATVTTLRLATNRMWTDQTSGQKREATEYHTVIAWGRLGEIANQYLKRGGLVMIEGRLQTRSWTDPNNVKRYFTEVIAENLQLGPRGTGGTAAEAKPAAAALPAQAGQPAPVDDIPIIDENEIAAAGTDQERPRIKEEDLPF